jgi:cytochrome c-type biogenesis protein CcmH
MTKTEENMPKSTDSSSFLSSNLPRIALGGALALALGAAGYAVLGRDKAKTSVSAADAKSDQTKMDVGTSISQLEAKLKENPKDAEGWRMLGWAFFQTQRFAEAASAYGRATQLAPNKGEYWSSLGESLVLAGKGDVPADAKTAFTKAVALEPKDPRARYFLAVAKDLAGDHKGAVDDWFALLKDTPSGAPWEADVRRVIADVASREKIDIAARMASLRPAPAAGGSAVATAAIPGPSPAQMRDAASMPKGQQDMMVQGMVESLEGKLKTNPNNVNGWIMLMRSRMMLGETAKAGVALKSARSAMATDAKALALINDAAGELGVPAS